MLAINAQIVELNSPNISVKHAIFLMIAWKETISTVINAGFVESVITENMCIVMYAIVV
jgi:hypothetical protein